MYSYWWLVGNNGKSKQPESTGGFKVWGLVFEVAYLGVIGVYGAYIGVYRDMCVGPLCSIWRSFS